MDSHINTKIICDKSGNIFKNIIVVRDPIPANDINTGLITAKKQGDEKTTKGSSDSITWKIRFGIDVIKNWKCLHINKHCDGCLLYLYFIRFIVYAT